LPTLPTVSSGTESRTSPLAWLLIGLIHLYRLTLSPLLGLFAQCRFYPTCSRYGLDAVRKYGALKGGWMAVKRVTRCHPFHPGGYDPVE